MPRPQSSSSSTGRLGGNIGGGLKPLNPPSPPAAGSPPKGRNRNKKGLGRSSHPPHPGGSGANGISKSGGGGGVGVGNSAMRSGSTDDEFPGVTNVPSNSGMRRRLESTAKNAPFDDQHGDVADDTFIQGSVERQNMESWNSSDPIPRLKRRRKLEGSSRFPWSMVVVVEERVPNSPGLLVGSPRNLCHLGNAYINLVHISFSVPFPVI